MINDIPIPEILSADRSKLLSTVDRILTAKRRNLDADVTDLEHQIEDIVHGLYGLTPAEIEMVEGATHQRATSAITAKSLRNSKELAS
jgi:hypothetical protein